MGNVLARIRSVNPFASDASVGARVGSAVVIVVVAFFVVQAILDPPILLQTLARAIGLGSTYALVALGFVLIFKATQVVNFAQGALAMSGALFLSFLAVDEHIPFTTIQNPVANLGPDWMSWGLSVALALVFAALLGLVLERIVIRPMIGKPLFAAAVITLGVETSMRTFANDSVKTQPRGLGIPWGTGGFNVGSAFINWSYVAAVLTAAVVFVAVYLFYRSRMGVAMRAVAYDQEAAMAQGISVGRVFAIAWAIGAVLAAIGGIFATQPPIDQTATIDADTQFIAFRALPVVILGGLDSVQGALLGGLIIGLAETSAGQYLSGHTNTLGLGYPLIVPYLVMIIGLLVRPYGMFGTPEIRRV